MSACTCEWIHARHIAASAHLQHDPCSLRCPACCMATFGQMPPTDHRTPSTTPDPTQGDAS